MPPFGLNDVLLFFLLKSQLLKKNEVRLSFYAILSISKAFYQIKQLMNVTYKLQENINMFRVFVEIKNRN